MDLTKLRSGSLLLVFNYSMTGCEPLPVGLSTDLGRTWPWRRDLAVGPHCDAHPVVIQTRDGTLHVLNTLEMRTVVNHAIFDEEWIEANK